MRLDDVVGAWTVVMPVKALSAAKSRLADALGPPADLALAFLTDTLQAVVATPAVADVIVVTSDATVRAVAESMGARGLDDAGHPGINAAAQWGRACGAPDRRSAVIVSDLPCLTPAAMTAVLGLAGLYPTSFVADADGTGTTMWLAGSATGDASHFGPASRDLHRRAGAIDLADRHPEAASALAPARMDVDTEAALERARAMGLGPRTRDALDRQATRT